MDGVLGAERVKFREPGAPLLLGEAPPGEDGEFKAGMFPLESEDYLS